MKGSWESSSYYKPGADPATFKRFQNGQTYEFQLRNWNSENYGVNSQNGWGSELSEPIYVTMPCSQYAPVASVTGQGFMDKVLKTITPSAFASNDEDSSTEEPAEEHYISGNSFISNAGEDYQPPPAVAQIWGFADRTMSEGDTVSLDMTEYFSGENLEYEVMLTTTHQSRGTTKTAPINTVSRNKIHGAWDEQVSCLPAGERCRKP